MYEANQFHGQDGLGRFVFGHTDNQQARLEAGNANGEVRGNNFSFFEKSLMSSKYQATPSKWVSLLDFMFTHVQLYLLKKVGDYCHFGHDLDLF